MGGGLKPTLLAGVGGVYRISLEPVGELAALGVRWRALEEDSEGGFFRSWTFLGCVAAEGFVGATLLSVTADGVDVALGLLGRGRWLNQTGLAAWDAVFIEHNGLLVRRGHAACVAPALRAAVGRRGAIVLSGVDEATLAAAQAAGWWVAEQSRIAPWVDLARLKRPFIETLSANARGQIRRAERAFGGNLTVARAETPEEALSFLAELIRLHQASWIRRGKPGAFANHDIRRFHARLVADGWPSGEVDLVRVTTGDWVVGVLYNFLHNGRVLNYQGGFAYPSDDARAKPGLVSHALAIGFYAARGMKIYDMLGGADRYKTTLAKESETLYWGRLYRRWSVRGAFGTIRAELARRKQSFFEKKDQKTFLPDDVSTKRAVSEKPKRLT